MPWYPSPGAKQVILLAHVTAWKAIFSSPKIHWAICKISNFRVDLHVLQLCKCSGMMLSTANIWDCKTLLCGQTQSPLS